MQSTLVFIDAGYLSKITKHFGFRLNLHELSLQMAKPLGLWSRHLFIYTAPPFQSNPPTAEEADRRRKHDKWVNKIEGLGTATVRQGRCQKVNGEYH